MVKTWKENNLFRKFKEASYQGTLVTAKYEGPKSFSIYGEDCPINYFIKTPGTQGPSGNIKAYTMRGTNDQLLGYIIDDEFNIVAYDDSYIFTKNDLKQYYKNKHLLEKDIIDNIEKYLDTVAFKNKTDQIWVDSWGSSDNSNVILFWKVASVSLTMVDNIKPYQGQRWISVAKEFLKQD